MGAWSERMGVGSQVRACGGVVREDGLGSRVRACGGMGREDGCGWMWVGCRGHAPTEKCMRGNMSAKRAKADDVWSICMCTYVINAACMY